MNVLSLGRPFGTPGEPLDHYRSARGHRVRRAGVDGNLDYRLRPGMTAAELVAEVRRDWNPELLICWCPEVAPPPLAIEASPIPTVAAVSDWTVYGPQLEYNLSRYDVVVIDRLGAQHFRPYGIAPRYIGPLYAHRTGVHRRIDVPRDIDVAFAGNLNHATHVRRGRLLEHVARLAGRYHVVIASELAPEAYTDLLNRTRIAFNYGLRHEMNLRCFEALACGALLFIEAENLEVGDWLKDREDVVRYTQETLVPLLHDYLAHPTEATRLAENAYAKSAGLAGERRLDDFIEAVAALPRSGRPFRELDAPTRALAEVLQYASSEVPWQQEHAHRSLADARLAHPKHLGIKLADGCMALEKAVRASGTGRDTTLRSALDLFGACATEHPGHAVCWMNLAFVSRHASAVAAERRFLELALEADDAAHGGLLLGGRQDPYYQRWREALSRGEAKVDMLHAAASARLAVLDLDAGAFAHARARAQDATAYLRADPAEDIALPHFVLGKALLAEGDATAAARVLRESLVLTALDSPHRNALIDALVAAGTRDEATRIAEDSATIFSAWPAAAHVVRAFRARADELRTR